MLVLCFMSFLPQLWQIPDELTVCGEDWGVGLEEGLRERGLRPGSGLVKSGVSLRTGAPEGGITSHQMTQNC